MCALFFSNVIYRAVRFHALLLLFRLEADATRAKRGNVERSEVPLIEGQRYKATATTYDVAGWA